MANLCICLIIIISVIYFRVHHRNFLPDYYFDPRLTFVANMLDTQFRRDLIKLGSKWFLSRNWNHENSRRMTSNRKSGQDISALIVIRQFNMKCIS